MTPKEAIERIDDISCDIELLKMVKFALYRMIPRFVLVPKGFEGINRTRYHCPSCKAMTRDHEKYCHKCGQAVKYPKLVASKAENKLVLDWSDSNEGTTV